MCCGRRWLLAALVVGACGGGPTQPTTPGPQLSCPAAQSAWSLDGAPVAVSYGEPVVTGGTAPVSVTCTPASGSNFPLGTTAVSCSGRDAQQRTASCSVAVTVIRPPQLSRTRFLAFGDSITEGKTGDCVRQVVNGVSVVVRDPFSLMARLLPPGLNYPTKLQNKLVERYVAQSPVALNDGFGGEAVTDSKARTRFVESLNQHQPDVVLLQEGINDLHGLAPVTAVGSALASLVRDARSRNIPVFVGTLLPEREGSCRAGTTNAEIQKANNDIRFRTVAEGATIVDLYAAFEGRIDTLLGEDGLHPTEEGYELMAQQFFDAIRASLELPTGAP